MAADRFAAAREAMVSGQIQSRGITDPRLLDAFRAVPRDAFVPPDLVASAYADHPLPIGGGQTISQPYIVALMIDAAGVAPGDHVLEIGAGSGYAAAVLGKLAADVTAIEVDPELARQAAARLASLGVRNVAIVAADGSGGWPAGAPYDAILVAATAPAVPRPLLEQLRCPVTDGAAGGRLVLPVARGGGEQLVLVTRRGKERWDEQALGAVRFVPLVGAHGFSARR